MHTTRLALATSLLALAGFAHVAPAAAQSKAELVDRLIQLQRPAEAVTVELVRTDASVLLSEAGVALQARVPADKRDAVADAIRTDVRKYVDTMLPEVRKIAEEQVKAKWAPVLAERFTEAELKQLIAWVESPLYRKHQELMPQLYGSLHEAVLGDVRTKLSPQIERVRTEIDQQLAPFVPPAPKRSPK